MSYSDPFERLMAEHQHGLRELDKMLASSRELKSAGFSVQIYEKLRDATRFINEDIRAHNKNEEEALFPALEEKMGQGGPTTVMRSEHVQLWTSLDKLEKELTELLNDTTSQPRISRVAELSAFIHDLLKNHIFKEDNILYPMARQMLTPEEILEISERMIHEPVPVPPSV